ncbi:hypothetical protein D1BOALGB6SA_8427 [Olavius sp. associated proteobacterium Delta 1]|nr:hypothetical protein D1BOALGB6SA_8427 [Olavius sp. associated proteobacterium Delta 1]
MTRIITHFMTHSKPVFGQECPKIYLHGFCKSQYGFNAPVNVQISSGGECCSDS